MLLLNSETPDGLEIPAPLYNNNFMLTVALQLMFLGKGYDAVAYLGGSLGHSPSGKKNFTTGKNKKTRFGPFV